MHRGKSGSKVKFIETEIPGAWILQPEPHSDERGFFARLWCEDEARAHGLDPHIAQINGSFNKLKGTLRGLHFQKAPHAEAKVVRCMRGAMFDVVVDLRPESPAYMRWMSVELNEHNRLALYIPPGCAHGFQTLADDTEVLYQVSVRYAPGAEGGAKFDDPAFGIPWPLPVTSISPRDLEWPLMLRASTNAPQSVDNLSNVELGQT
jgi:dTDP-4-dehydrorhamnose 3,5-epimerase